MFDTREQILNQLRAGEDGRAEFKEVRLRDRGVISPDTEDAAGGLAALANAAGGVLFLGIDDSGAVRGIPPEHVDTVENWIVNVATHNCEPPIRPILRKVLLPGSAGDEQRVLLAEVPRGLYVHRTSGGRYYMRIGSTKRDLTPPELVRLFQQRGREYVFDEQPVLAASVDDLNRHPLEVHTRLLSGQRLARGFRRTISLQTVQAQAVVVRVVRTYFDRMWDGPNYATMATVTQNLHPASFTRIRSCICGSARD